MYAAGNRLAAGNFNPRSPRGERPQLGQYYLVPFKFQSTLPARGATRLIVFLSSFTSDFNPRSPRGERPAGKTVHNLLLYFNPRSPRGERPSKNRLPAGG